MQRTNILPKSARTLSLTPPGHIMITAYSIGLRYADFAHFGQYGLLMTPNGPNTELLTPNDPIAEILSYQDLYLKVWNPVDLVWEI